MAGFLARFSKLVVPGRKVARSGARNEEERSARPRDRKLVNENSFHSLVPVKNKLFVVGSEKCEVYDDAADKFVVIESYESLPRCSRRVKLRAACIGNKIVVFGRKLSPLAFY